MRRWAEELPQVLWSYHTTPHSSTNKTPFRLTFGTEAVIPIKEYTTRRQQQRLAPKHFQPHDLVLKKITRTTDNNKLTLAWEGQYRITEEVGRGAYCLENLADKKIPRTWNFINLRVYNN
ncbi:hypothetical protein CR513_08961, partial [Mucuna pruriens]